MQRISKPVGDISDFEDRLQRVFGGRLRIRWSYERGEWHIEQKVRRAWVEGIRPSKRGWDESMDAYVRYRDGYIHVMSVRTGDRMPCPRCGHELKVPFMQTTHVKCGYCTLTGKPKYVAAVYMPLGDRLIEHLRSIDPEHPISEQLAADLERENEALARTMEEDAIRPTEAAFHDDYNRVVGIPEFGYSGKTSMWENAPASPMERK